MREKDNPPGCNPGGAEVGVFEKGKKGNDSKNSEENGQLHQIILENANDLVHSVDLDGNFLYVNYKWKKILGYGDHEIPNLKIWDIIHSREIPRCQNIMNRLKKGEIFEGVETVFVAKNGEEVYVEGNIRPYIKQDGFMATCAVFRDITERKCREAEIKTYQESVDKLLNSLSDAVFLKDKNLRYLIVNEAAAAQFNKRPEDLIGKNDSDFMPPDVAEKCKRSDVNALGSPEAIEGEEWVGERCFHVIKQRVLDNNGYILGIASVARDISKQKNAENALREKEKLYSTLVENVNDMVYMLDSRGNVTFFNNYVKEHYSLSDKEAEQLQNTPLSFFWCDKSINEVQEAINEVVEHKKEQSLECICEDRYYLLKITPLLSSGKLIGMIAVARDFTKQKKVEKALKESKERYQTLIESADDFIYLVDNEGNVLSVNSSAASVFNKKPEDIIGKSIFDLFPPELAEGYLENIKRVFKTGEPQRTENKMIAGEKESWISANLNPVRNNGNIVAVMGISRDLTEYKDMEEELRRSSKRLKTILDYSNVGIVIIDATNHQIVDANSMAVDTVGVSKNDLLGRKCHEFVCSSQKEKECSTVMNNRLDTSEELLLNASGERIPVIKTTVPVTMQNHHYLIVSFVDITERKKIEQAKDQLNEVLKLINKILRHDILNEVTVLSNTLEIYQDTKDESIMDKAFQSINRTVDLIKSMKDLESLVSSGGTLKPYDVNELIHHVASNYPIDYRVEGECTVQADEAFSPVINNILSNAVRHGQADRVDFWIKSNGRDCTVKIADNGKGIEENIKEKVFEEGFSGSTGTGLGLYIVRKTVERYGGKVYVEDNQPNGTVIILKLSCSQ